MFFAEYIKYLSPRSAIRTYCLFLLLFVCKTLNLNWKLTSKVQFRFIVEDFRKPLLWQGLSLPALHDKINRWYRNTFDSESVGFNFSAFEMIKITLAASSYARFAFAKSSCDSKTIPRSKLFILSARLVYLNQLIFMIAKINTNCNWLQILSVWHTGVE